MVGYVKSVHEPVQCLHKLADNWKPVRTKNTVRRSVISYLEQAVRWWTTGRCTVPAHGGRSAPHTSSGFLGHTNNLPERELDRWNHLNACTVHLLLFCAMNQKMHTVITQIITLLHASTLLCHPQAACNQYFAKLHQYFIILYNEPTNAHNNFTNYHTATWFDTTVSSSGSLQSISCQVTPVF